MHYAPTHALRCSRSFKIPVVRTPIAVLEVSTLCGLAGLAGYLLCASRSIDLGGAIQNVRLYRVTIRSGADGSSFDDLYT